MKENNNNNKSDALSINRFRDMKVEDMSDEEYQDFVVASLLKKTLETLEFAIHSDRIFTRARYEVFTAFWEARDRLASRRDKDLNDEHMA